MDKTKLFEDTADPAAVAKAGYEAMLEGELNVVAGVSFAQKMMMKTLPLMPKGTVLKQVRKMQEQK